MMLLLFNEYISRGGVIPFEEWVEKEAVWGRKQRTCMIRNHGEQWNYLCTNLTWVFWHGFTAWCSKSNFGYLSSALCLCRDSPLVLRTHIYHVTSHTDFSAFTSPSFLWKVDEWPEHCQETCRGKILNQEFLMSDSEWPAMRRNRGCNIWREWSSKEILQKELRTFKKLYGAEHKPTPLSGHEVPRL